MTFATPTETPTFAGTPPFPEAARAALANGQLRENLARATNTFRTKRARTVADRADWESLRSQASTIKDDVLARLPELLQQFEAAATAAGSVVHWARDADEANEIITALVRRHDTRDVVKVKSITTQETELNGALERAGIEPWETDLAELIIQLGHDLPSHFLTPSIHRNRREIREIFVREMGQVGRPAPDDLTDDPRDLADAARLHLRERFLRAKVGISGANFGVAETGTVVLVESEGNGRMCVTLPDVLITLMGVEKMVPSWQELAVFLQLLPRSAAAERMNPYTSTWTGVTPGDGPQEVHIVLLDAGRTKVLADPVGRQTLRCIRCAACVNVCPVYERTGGVAYGSPYSGPIGAILTPQLRGMNQGPVDEQTASLPYASSLCGACADVCPVRIDIPEVLLDLRAKAVHWKKESGAPPTAESLLLGTLAWTFGSPRRLDVAERAASLGGRVVGRHGRIRRAFGPSLVTAWFRGRDLVSPGRESFRRWWRRTQRSSSVATRTPS